MNDLLINVLTNAAVISIIGTLIITYINRKKTKAETGKLKAETDKASAEAVDAMAGALKHFVDGNITWVQLTKAQADHWLLEVNRLTERVEDLHIRLTQQEKKNQFLQDQLLEFNIIKNKLIEAEKQIERLKAENTKLKNEIKALKSNVSVKT